MRGQCISPVHQGIRSLPISIHPRGLSPAQPSSPVLRGAGGWCQCWLPDQLHHMHNWEQAIRKAGKWQRNWQTVLKPGDLLDMGKFLCSEIFPWVMGQKSHTLLTAGSLLWFQGTVLSSHPQKVWQMLSRLLQTQTSCWYGLKPHCWPQILL